MGLFEIIKELIKNKQNKKDNQIIVKNYISGNNNQTTNNNSKNSISQKKMSNKYSTNTNKTMYQNNIIEVQNIRLYCTGAKGKVYTSTFRKSLNNNFGIEITIKNNTSQTQTVKLGHCIYDKSGNNTLFKSTFYPQIKPMSTLTESIFIDNESFKKMKKGKYKSQFWLNDNKIQKVFFNVVEK